MTDILMPALSPTMEEGTLAKWLVKAGDTVEAGQVIAEIETDKATMEVEAVDEGVVDAILVEAGTEGVKVNSPIARLKSEGADAPPPPRDARSPSPASGGGSEEPSAVLSGSSTAPAGEGDHAQRGGGGAPLIAQVPPPAAPSQTGGETGATAAPAHPTQPSGGERVAASPLARRLAQAAGLDLASLKGSGPHGRVVMRDVGAARGKPQSAPVAIATAPPVAAPAPSPAAEPAAQPRTVKSLEQLGIPPGSYDLVPLDGMGKTIARRMTDSFRDIPHFPLTIDLEIDALLDARTRINKMLEPQGVKVSVNDLVIKAVAVALKQVPAANASYSPEGLAMHHNADVAFAVALDQGLITPIVRKAETKGLAQIARETKDLAERARSRKLKPEEYQGGTFSVSNLGMFGIKSFASIINEPQGCIMSVGAGEQRPVVKGGQLAIATVMTVTLTCDHRVVDGAIGARFLQAFKSLLEEPLTMIV